MSRVWAGGSTRQWRAISAAVLERDGRACRLRLPGPWLTKRGWRRCLGSATQVHHLHGKGRCPGCTPPEDLDHLVASCQPCNIRIEVVKRQRSAGAVAPVKSVSLRRTPFQ